MVDNNIICSDTMETLDDCKCYKCKHALEFAVSLDSSPEDGTDQARLLDMAMAHLIFPPDKGESFDEIMKKAQE